MEHQVHVQFVANLLDNALELPKRNIAQAVDISSHKKLLVRGQILPQRHKLVEIQPGCRLTGEQLDHQAHGGILEPRVVEIGQSRRQLTRGNASGVVGVYTLESRAQFCLQALFA